MLFLVPAEHKRSDGSTEVALEKKQKEQLTTDERAQPRENHTKQMKGL